jgi:hypothetical protein
LSGSSSSEEEETPTKGQGDRWNLNSLFQGQESFGHDSPNFVKIFGGHSKRPGQFETVFSDIEFDEEAEVAKAAPVTADSRGKKRKAPSPSKKKKGSKKRSVEYVDDSRPLSEKAAFDRLHNSKQQYRTQKQQQIMAKTKLGPKISAKDRMESPRTTRVSDRVAKRPSTNAEDSGRVSKKNRRLPLQISSPTQEVTDDGGRGSSASGRDSPSIEQDTSTDVMDDDDVHEHNAEMDRVLAEQRAKDKKIPKEKRLEVIADCRKTIYVLKMDLANNHVDVKAMKKMQKEIAQLKKNSVQNDMLAQKQAVVMKVNEEILKQIDDAVKNKLYKIVKFINCTETECKAAVIVLDHIKLPQMSESPEARASAIKAYKRPIKQKLFLRKGYVNAEMKKLAFKMLKKNVELPSYESVLKCANRTIDVDDEDEMNLFMWYWEDLLPKMVGAKEWDGSVCYYTTISSAKMADQPKDALVTVSDEAMTALMWENCLERYKACYAFTKNTANAGKKQPNLPGKYTVLDKGQAKWGGWTNEGVQQFNKYFLEVKAGRKSANCAPLEAKCLEMLRKKYNIVCPTPEEQEKYNRSIKRAAKKGATLEVGAVSVPMPPLGGRTVQALIDDGDSESASDEE